MTATSMRAVNRATLIAAVRRTTGLTRAALSEATGPSKGAVSSLVAELLKSGVLYEGGKDGSRNRALHLNNALGVALGIEVGASECRGIVTDIGITPSATPCSRSPQPAWNPTSA